MREQGISASPARFALMRAGGEPWTFLRINLSVGRDGIEPSTSYLSGKRSTSELPTQIDHLILRLGAIESPQYHTVCGSQVLSST